MTDSKDKVYWKILNAALELDCKKGHLKWSLTDLSRKAKVTRSLIYYYFGRSKAGILDEAIKLIGSEFIGLSKERMALWGTGRLKESMLRTREFVDKMPYLCQFILEHRKNQTEIGKGVLSLEKKFVKKVTTHFSNLDKESIEAIYTMYWGMCFTPDISPKALMKLVQIIEGFQKA